MNGQAYTFAGIVNITLEALYNFGPADFPNLAKLLQALYTHSAAGSAAAAQLIAGLRGSRPAPAYYNGLESFLRCCLLGLRQPPRSLCVAAGGS